VKYFVETAALPIVRAFVPELEALIVSVFMLPAVTFPKLSEETLTDNCPAAGGGEDPAALTP
jgi:hypothetical protein